MAWLATHRASVRIRGDGRATIPGRRCSRLTMVLGALRNADCLRRFVFKSSSLVVTRPAPISHLPFAHSGDQEWSPSLVAWRRSIRCEALDVP